MKAKGDETENLRHKADGLVRGVMLLSRTGASFEYANFKSFRRFDPNLLQGSTVIAAFLRGYQVRGYM